ncbi:DUF2284 domain-containing protein [Natranaerofaba carboxydovora]|uniref:DUF2284 domain-containing protein n=1 Tax=Natranaerofaba carboxydovora TaxID=2742683 RepID=UPI001F135C60|nr:DUF2284 domain-containing protein [Natranaerofaba carboxydovora]UMZ74871.1 hypothetical protein ACONDI_02475 [Natranaerofaba carboxydovora]
MDFWEQIKKSGEIMSIFEEGGVYRQKLIKTRKITVDERVRFQCSHLGCGSYGKPMCPPNLPSIDEFKRFLAGYSFGIIVQLAKDIPDTTPADEAKEIYNDLAVDLHRLILKGERKAFSEGFPFAGGFIGGACKLCKACKTPCINKDDARPSMEGMGIDVLETCRQFGLDVTFDKSRIIWTGLLLLD